KLPKAFWHMRQWQMDARPTSLVAKRTAPHWQPPVRVSAMSALLEFVPDGVGDAVRVGSEVGIPDADRGETLFRERGGAVLVGCAACVLAAVELDDQAAGITDEIRDKGADGNLAAELEAGEAAVLEDEPELLLGFRGIAAHGFGEAAVAALAQAMGLVGAGDNGGRGCPLTPGPSPTGGEGGDGDGPC